MRLTFAASFILAVIKVRAVTFNQLALLLDPRVKPASNVRRMQRFFAQFSFRTATFGRLMLALLPQKDDLVVTIDRTHWKLGSVDLNILMFSVAHKGIAFPVAWSLLGNADDSNGSERRLLLGRFLELVEPVASV